MRLDVAERVRAGGLGYAEAVGNGLYVPLGEGDANIAGIVRALEEAGYGGWYVLEQDAVLAGDPATTGVDPARDVEASVRFLGALAAQHLGMGT